MHELVYYYFINYVYYARHNIATILTTTQNSLATA